MQLNQMEQRYILEMRTVSIKAIVKINLSGLVFTTRVLCYILNSNMIIREKLH